MLAWVVIYRRHLRQSPHSRFIRTLPLPASHLPYALPSSVSRNPFVCHSYENCRVTSFKPKVFLFPRRALSLLFSLFVPRAFQNSFPSKGIRTLSKNCRVSPNNSRSGTRPVCSPPLLPIPHSQSPFNSPPDGILWVALLTASISISTPPRPSTLPSSTPRS